MADVAKASFESKGYTVKISDLYAMNFDPVNDRRNFKSVKDASRFSQQVEETHAVATDGFAPEIKVLDSLTNSH